MRSTKQREKKCSKLIKTNFEDKRGPMGDDDGWNYGEPEFTLREWILMEITEVLYE